MIALKVGTDRVEDGKRVYDTYAVENPYAMCASFIGDLLGVDPDRVRIVMACFGIAETLYVEID